MSSYSPYRASTATGANRYTATPLPSLPWWNPIALNGGTSTPVFWWAR